MSNGLDTDRRFWHRLGFVAGFFAAVFLMAAALALGGEYTVAKVVDLLNRWQTLVTGLLALGGAILTVAAIERQIDQQRQQEDDQRARRHYAARAGMPAALTQMVRYTRSSLAVLKAISPPPNAAGRILHAAPWTPPQAPDIPSGALATLQTCIESAEPHNMPVIAQLIEDFQVLHARLTGLIQEVSPGSTTIVTLHHLIERILDTLEYDLRCSNMFDYARRRSTEATAAITQGNISTRAFFEDFHDADYPGLDEAIQRRYGAQQ